MREWLRVAETRGVDWYNWVSETIGKENVIRLRLRSCDFSFQVVSCGGSEYLLMRN